MKQNYPNVELEVFLSQFAYLKTGEEGYNNAIDPLFCGTQGGGPAHNSRAVKLWCLLQNLCLAAN